MPSKAKTKKTTKKGKKIKKVLGKIKRMKTRRKTIKILPKKSIRKKAVYKQTAPILNSLEEKTVLLENNEPIFLPPAIIETPQPIAAPKKINAKRSPYLLDLKNIKEQEKINKEQNANEADPITAEIFNKLNKKTTKFNHNLKKAYNNLKINLGGLKPKARIKNPSSQNLKTNHTFSKFLTINWPDFNWQLPKFQPQEIRLGNLLIPSHWKKAIFSFVIFCFIFVSPFILYGYYQNLQGKKNDILDKTSQALFHLALSQKAASAQDLYYTNMELQAASQNFSQAQKEFSGINFLAQEAFKIVPQVNKQFITAKKLVEIGQKLSASAVLITDTLSQINSSSTDQNQNLTDKLSALKDSLNLVLPDIKLANQDLNDIYLNEIPQEYQSKIELLQTNLPVLEKNITKFINYSDLILKFLGQDSQKRYLLLFQNNNEIRPTGGFIGSYALIDIDRGNIRKINVPSGGPYDLRAGLKANIKSPLPLNIINPRWEFQDANWFADLPTSADKLIWFYEKSGGPTVDGLIFVNATFLEKILALTGPIELTDYNKTITAENFFTEIQESVELEYDKTQNKPKQIIADLTPIIINRLLHTKQQKFSELLDIMLSSLSEKEIQLYFTNYSLEKLVLDNNWGGQMKDTDNDYLEIVSTNIAGEKTDAKIDQQADLKTAIQPDGTIINTLTITKTHTGQAGEVFYGVPNIDYLRIYVPKGSELLSATGFSQLPEEFFLTSDTEIYDIDPDLAYSEFSRKLEPTSQTAIYNEGNKTVFANWLKIDPSQTQTVMLQYKLPFKLSFVSPNNDLLANIFNKLNFKEEHSNLQKYSLLWQKQSGKKNYPISSEIIFPQELNYQIIYPDNLKKNGNNFIYKSALNDDKFLAIIFNSF